MIGRPSPLAILVAVVIGLGASPPCARAETIVVDTVDDELDADGDCSLREALRAANLNVAVDACPAGSDTDTDEIVLSAGTYTLTLPPVFEFPETGGSGDLDVVDNMAAVDLIVTGAGAGTTIIEACTVDQLTAACPSGQGVEDRVVEIWAGATAAIRGVTMRHGTATGAGGGVVNFGTLTIEDSVVAASRGANGGGIWNPGTLELVESSVVQNWGVGDGGGVYSSGAALVLTRATVAGNQAGRGGGITVDGGTMAAVGSTIAGNQAASSGGGIVLWFGITAVMTNSTVSGNTTNFNGGGIFVSGTAALTLNSCTVTDNRAVPSGSDGDAGGIFTLSTLVMRNTILAGNVDATPGSIGAVPDCFGTLGSEGHNLLGDPRGCTGLVDGVNGDRVGTAEAPIDPMIGALTENGGPTETHALLAGSPAVDAGDPAGCTDETGTLLIVDQTGEPRTADGNGDGIPRCDVGSFELGGGVAQSFAIRPTRGGNAGPFRIVFYGTGFADGATAALVRSGEPDIVAEEVVVASGGAVLAAVFDLAGRALGQWDAVVTNPGGSSQTSPAAFTVQEVVEPRLWADLVGPTAMRVGRPTTFYLLYGNRGNVDALGVPVVIGLPRDFTFEVDVVPPTGEPGDPAIDWSRVPATMGSPDLPGVQAISLLLPAVPAGFTSTFGVTVTAPLSAIGRAVEFPFAIGQPYVGPALDPQVTTLLVSGARTYARRVLDVGISRTLIPEMEAYVAAWIADVVRTDLGALVAGRANPRAIPHLLVGLAAVYQSSGEGCGGGIDEDGDGLADEADPDCQPEDDEEEDEDGDDDDDEDEECDPEEAENPWYADDDCDGEPDCKEGGFDTCAPAPCKKWPPTRCGGTPPSPDLIASHDPNDKVGSLGGGDGRYVTGVDPLRYVVSFENLPTATAAAQEVVITDQLDPDTMDLATLSLGPIAFGDRQVVPPPGLGAFQTDVDLRPEHDLILRIAAALDPDTSVLTWRFTSLDPATGEPTTDPFAGFLPPNLVPPEGQGSVLFTVDSRDGLATGTEIRNGASIVFDVNEPIVTPEWVNTIDAEAPASQATAAGGGSCSQQLDVTWAGTDAGAGVQSYDVLVSENGGPLTTWLAGAAETGGTFHGKWGASYGFATVARDGAGNVEEAPAAPDVSASVEDCGPFNLAVTKIRVPKRVKLSRKKPVATVTAKVQIQNRSPTAQTIPSLQTLRELVGLDLASLGGCPAPDPVLLSGKPQKKRPITIKPKRKLNVAFEITIGCANDGLKSSGRSPGHDDYTVSARVHQSVLGGADAFPDDDACPRIVAPPGVQVPFPNRKIVDKGCGTRRPDRTRGDPVVVDVVDKR